MSDSFYFIKPLVRVPCVKMCKSSQKMGPTNYGTKEINQ